MKLLPNNAKDIMIKRYALRNEKNEPVETALDILTRAARVVAQAENNFRDGVTPQQVEAKFFELLADFRFLPNGRTLANAGTTNGQLANCFVLPLEDDLGKSENSIFSILKKSVLVLQSGGGVGFSFGRIRPKGDQAGRGKATGAVSFIKVFDTAFWVIGQGGGRRSACMAVLPVWHPDILDFISCKEKEGVIEHFNISVGITDAFMEAVDKDKNFELINPKNQVVWKTVRARELFNKIVRHAYRNGEPGVLFLDMINKYNPVPNQYVLEATNPCGEQALGPFENCCMASINLAEHTKVIRKIANSSNLYNQEIDWEKLKETVVWTVRWLDDVIEANTYVTAVPEIKEAALRNRRIGVSIMGLSDMFYKVGIRYGSDRAVDLAGQIMEFIRFESMQASIQLARERGAFPGLKGSIYDYSHDSEGFWGNVVAANKSFKAPKPIKPYKHKFDCPILDWKNLIKDLKKYGIRNSAQTTIQPTGAIATIAGLEGYGCEPVFALSYVMKTHEGATGGKEWVEVNYESKAFKEALSKLQIHKFTNSQIKSLDNIFEKVRIKGSCQDIGEIPKEIQEVFVVSGDVKVEEHVRMQAALQAFTDNAISKTINFPSEATESDVAKAYLQGWKMGLKGMTVYVTGSRETVILETKETAKKKLEPFVTDLGVMGQTIEKIKTESDGPCPECGATMVLSEGCIHCPACGYAKCGM